jgi:hypothetical protein
MLRIRKALADEERRAEVAARWAAAREARRF